MLFAVFPVSEACVKCNNCPIIVGYTEDQVDLGWHKNTSNNDFIFTDDYRNRTAGKQMVKQSGDGGRREGWSEKRGRDAA